MVLDSMEIKSVAICIGGSLGGMNTLEWALLRGYVKHIVAIATSGRYSAWGISWNEVQRQTICNDKKFMDGYYSLEDPPRDGLCAARIQALLTYRTSESFEFRFARRRASGLSSSEINGIPNKPFLAQTYLQYQGEKFVSRFDANCYLKLLEKMDSHDLGAGREGYEQTLKSIEQPTLIVGIASDGLFKLTEQKELAKLIPKAELKLIESADGHDAFLIEFTQLNRILLSFINRHLSHFKPYANEKQNQAYFQSKDLNGISIPQKVGDGLI